MLNMHCAYWNDADPDRKYGRIFSLNDLAWNKIELKMQKQPDATLISAISRVFVLNIFDIGGKFYVTKAVLFEAPVSPHWIMFHGPNRNAFVSESVQGNRNGDLDVLID